MSTYVEPVIKGVEKVKIQSRAGLKSAPSLRPGVEVCEGCAAGNPLAQAIVEAWRFKANRATRIIVVSREEYARMVEKGTVNFGS
jgi:hypothetical protein